MFTKPWAIQCFPTWCEREGSVLLWCFSFSDRSMKHWSDASYELQCLNNYLDIQVKKV